MFRHYFRILILVLLAYTSQNVYAKTISVDAAKQLAVSFVSATRPDKDVAITHVHTSGSVTSPLYYVFNMADDKGFVIVSAEDCTTPILGYSMDNGYPVGRTPEAMNWMMEGIEKELKAAPSIQKSMSESVRKEAARRVGMRASAGETLLSTPSWSQEAPFNGMIPGKPLVGCVGTAMATIMKYHNYPAKGTGSFDGVSFDVEYDWANMRSDNYRNGYSEAEGNAVAMLMWHAAKSIDTQFGMSGSSAYEVRVPAALSNYFGYNPGVSYKKRSEVSSQEAWDKIVRDEIDAGRPVLYCGQDVTAGHAFVCDGYNSQGYLHFNWGWGGAANGFFLSTALNPTVSTSHQFNNLNTIIYNIKPGDGTSTWSPIHITADGNQPGIGSDMVSLSAGKKFTVRVGNLKNLSYTDFSGKIAVALYDAAGNFKTLLSNAAGFSLQSMATLGNGYVDFRECALPDGVTVNADDMLRIATSADNGKTWLAVAGELLTINEIAAGRTTADYFSIKYPASVAGVSYKGADRVIRGWNHTFTVTAANPAQDVVTVKANGYILTAGNDDSYTIGNVREDQEISIIVQKASEIKEKRSVWVDEGGRLESIIPESETGTIKDLTLYGTIDARDFEFMRTKMKLTRLDISSVYIAANGSSQACALPRSAFQGQSQLREVVLPKNLDRINNSAFRLCGITSIVIPASVKTYEYNVFLSCTALRDIWVGRETAEFINWCVLSGTNKQSMTLHVPTERALNNYKNKEYWKEIGTIVVDPVPAATDVSFAVMENSDVKFDSATEPGRVQKGTVVTFTAEHLADNDNRMEVYANTTLLRPDAKGVYTVTVNSNTILHFDMVKPQPVNSYASYWQLTNTGGTVGLLTDAVNVIPGSNFTIRANALYIPAEYVSMFWAAVLTDADNNIKEFISPVALYSGISGDGLKMNINCCVKESTVRAGNKIRLVTSFNKKTWSLVEGRTDDVIDALQALNNQTPVYNINIPAVDNAVITGAVSTAVRGRDITIKVTPKSATDRVNMSVNGSPVAQAAPFATYSFIAKQDMDFDIEVFTPSVANEAVYVIGEGERLYYTKADNADYINLNNANLAKIGSKVTVIGKIDKTDFSFFKQPKVQSSVVSVDLSQAEIIADRTNPQAYAANMFPPEAFYSVTPFGQVAPAIRELKLPGKVVQIMGNAFNNCGKIEELELPENLYNEQKQTLPSGGTKYVYGLEGDVFNGCSALKTLYLNCAPVNGRVSLIKPVYNGIPTLGLKDPTKVTVIVKPEYLQAYRTDNQGDWGNYFGNGTNIWYGAKFNILSEYPVYGINYQPARCFMADSDTDITRVVSFLGENVPLDSCDFAGALHVAVLSPSENRPAGVDGYVAGRKVKIYDNERLLENAVQADGTVSVTYWNPNKHADKSGNHDIKVKYLYDVKFDCMSDLFDVDIVGLRNNVDALGENATEFEVWNTADSVAPVLENVCENTTVRFTVSMPGMSDNLIAKVKVNDNIIEKDVDGSYSIDVAQSDVTVRVYSVPVNGATLTQDELNSVDPSEAAEITSMSLAGEVTEETLASIATSFPDLEILNMSEMDGTVPANAFAGMKSLTTVTLPESAGTIEPGTFRDCESLTSVVVPQSVSTVGAEAFSGCASLTSITLTGIDYIGENAFNGCDKLTSVNLNAQLASAPARSNVAKAEVVAFDAKAFSGINPNCLILVDDGVSVPETESGNYIVTTIGDITETIDGKPVVRKGRIYTADGDIDFRAGWPLAIANNFTVKEANTVSLNTPAHAASQDGWLPLLIPFKATKAAKADGTVIALTDKDEPTSTDTYTVIAPGVKDEFVAQSELAANVPYLVRMSAGADDGEICFSAKGARVSATPDEIATDGNGYRLVGTYKAVEAAGMYILNDGGTAFERVDAEAGSGTIAPFEVYAVSESGKSEIRIVYTPVPSAVDDMAEDAANGMEYKVENGMLVINATAEMDIAVYGADGRIVRMLSLKPGRNMIAGLAQGVYIIAGKKVVL